MKNGRQKKLSASENPDERTVLQPQIEKRAYELWLEDGCRHGSDIEHWLLAEREFAKSRVRQARERVE